jgi:RimJ/RimL family protein N-acetyltransferase
MLRGERVGLRAREQADVAVLHSELYDDVAGRRSQADTRAWRPIPVGPGSPFAVGEPSDETAAFSVVELATGELAGEALLWNVDQHNRVGHLGISLRPGFRGRGLGTDVVRVLTQYGFATRGLHRMQLETLADNKGMLAAANRVGYRRE